VRINGHRILRRDGLASAVVVCGQLDVRALDPDRRGAVTGAFGHLCRAADFPLQIIVQVRHWPSTTADVAQPLARGDPMADALVTAEREHAAATLAARPAFGRRVLLVPSTVAHPAEPLDRALALVREALAAAGVPAEVLSGDGLRDCLAEAWGGDPAGEREGVSRPQWSLSPFAARSGGLWLRGFRLRRLPGVAVEPGWLAPLLLVRAECDIALHLHPTPLPEAMSLLRRRLRTLRADQLVDLDREGLGDAAVEAGVDGVLDLRDRLARNTARSVRLSVSAVARARGPAELDAASAALQVAFSTALTECETTHFEHLDTAVTAWPLGSDRSSARKLVDTAALATCAPWVEAVCFDADGYPLGRASTTDSPVRLDPFDVTAHSNANICILAASGRGKSYAIGGILLAAAARGVGSVIIDPEGEYLRVVRALGGDYLHLAPGCGAALNIFDVGEAAPGDTDRSAEVVGAVVDLVNVLLGGSLDDVERAHVDAAAHGALHHARRSGQTALLGDCVAPLEESAPRVAAVLRRFCGGALGELFNRPTSVSLDGPVVGICLRDLRDELVPAATLIVAEWLWALVRRQRRRRHIVFDEVGLLCAHAPLRALLAQLARRCRKYGASLVVATQNAGDLLASEEGTVIATNPAIVLLGGHRGAETARMGEAYALTDGQRASLESAGRGEFLLLAGARRLAVRIELPPLHHSILTGG